jgi:hypothetical protein
MYTVVPIGPEVGDKVVVYEGHVPVPCTSKVYGFSLESLFTIEMVAVLTPEACGVNVIVKGIEVANTEPTLIVEGIADIEKSPGFAPIIVTAPIVKLAVPSFSI